MITLIRRLLIVLVRILVGARATGAGCDPTPPGASISPITAAISTQSR